MAASTLLGLPSCRFKSLSITARSSSSSSSQLYAATAIPSLSFSSGNSLNLFSTGLVSSKPVRRQLGGFIVCEAAALPKKVDSAVKRARQAEKRRMYNRARKSEVITRMKKKSKALAFVPTISQSYRDRHSIPRPNAENTSEDESLSSPGQGSSTAAGREPIAPEGWVLLDRVVHDGKCVISISPSMQFIYNAHTSPSRWFGEILRNHPFQEFFPTPKTLSKSLYELWLSEFQREYCCPDFSQQHIEKAFKEMVYNCYKGYVHRMHKKWKKTGQAAPNYSPELWAKWEEHWRSQKFQNISDIAKTNRNSNEGQGSVHMGGSISLSELWDRLVKCHGPDVDASEVFLATHSSVSPNGTRKWSSRHYQEVYETYVRRAREEAIEEGIIEIESAELPPFRAGLWKAITIHGQQRGDRLPGFGNHGAAFFDLPLSSRSSQSSISSSSVD